MYVEPEEYQNTDNILYIKPYQLVLVAFSTRRKTHTCRFTHTSWCYQTRKEFNSPSLILRGPSPGCWARTPQTSVHRKTADMCVFVLTNALRHNNQAAGRLPPARRQPGFAAPGRCPRADGRDAAARRWASSCWRAGPLYRGERRKRRRRGTAATALPSWAGSSRVCARDQAGAEQLRASPGPIAAPARLGPRPPAELAPGKASAGSRRSCSPGKVGFSFAARAGVVWLQVCTSPPPAVGYGGLIRLHFCFILFFFLKQPASEAFLVDWQKTRHLHRSCKWKIAIPSSHPLHPSPENPKLLAEERKKTGVEERKGRGEQVGKYQVGVNISLTSHNACAKRNKTKPPNKQEPKPETCWK